MPYMLDNPENGKCVHKQNKDKSMGELVKCHESHEKAVAHMTALRLNVEEAAKYAQVFVPGYKAITDAPFLRNSQERHCGNCNFYKSMPSYDVMMDHYLEQGICQKYEFLTQPSWVCNSWKEFVLEEPAMKASMMEKMMTKIDEMSEEECRSMLKKMGEDSKGMSEEEMKSKLKKMAKSQEEKMMEMMPMKAERYGGKPRSELKDSDFVFPDERTFPVMVAGDVEDAVNSWGRYRGSKSFEEFKRKLTALAKRKGFESSLPEKWEIAAKFSVKVAGDWELDVLGNPFGPDSDDQYFDRDSKIVSGSDIPVIYYHSLEDTSRGVTFAGNPVVIGKASNPETKQDGIWWRVILDKTVKEAKKVWDAAKEGLAVASSGAIDYLSRLEINGKLVQYDKSKPGRIAIWHMGELSLWDYGNGHLPQSHPHAVAIPALKAIYEAASLPLPPSLVSSKNAEFPMDGKRKEELEKLHKFTDEIEKFIEINKD